MKGWWGILFWRGLQELGRKRGAGAKLEDIGLAEWKAASDDRVQKQRRGDGMEEKLASFLVRLEGWESCRSEGGGIRERERAR
jgi:hypothetical protein